MEALFWTLAGFISGSIPFSVILGRFARRVDIREYGDHNPGGTNVIRAAGWRWGSLALVLDFLKGAIPVGLAWFLADIRGAAIIPVALAPVFGHAFTPWLGLRGGKTVATTFGIWSGLTLGVGPILLGMLLGLAYAVLQSSGWAVILTMLSFGGFIWSYFGHAHPEWMWVWAGNLALLVWKHRHDLAGYPKIRPELLGHLRGRG